MCACRMKFIETGPQMPRVPYFYLSKLIPISNSNKIENNQVIWSLNKDSKFIKNQRVRRKYNFLEIIFLNNPLKVQLPRDFIEIKPIIRASVWASLTLWKFKYYIFLLDFSWYLNIFLLYFLCTIIIQLLLLRVNLIYLRVGLIMRQRDLFVLSYLVSIQLEEDKPTSNVLIFLNLNNLYAE